VTTNDDKVKAEKYANELKRLRNPDIVKYLDTVIYPEKIWLVTENVAPLEKVKESLTYSQLVLSMERVMHALKFLHSKAKMSHNNVCLASIFMYYDEGKKKKKKERDSSS
jgi:SCY1-like protein 3